MWINRTAGGGRAESVLDPTLRALGRAGHSVTVIDAETADQAQQRARSAVADGAGLLVAIGGDGTVHHEDVAVDIDRAAVAGAGLCVGWAVGYVVY